jgi:hypothetical protein
MPIYGHKKILDELKREGSEVPSVLLFSGPPSVGKWATAEHLRTFWRVSSADVLRIRTLTAESATNLVWFAQLAPQKSELKLVIVQIDKARPEALNTLLKVLESRLMYARIILVSESDPLTTISSRASQFEFSTLSTSEVESVLLDKKFNSTEAKVFSELSQGSVQRALEAFEGNDIKPLVLSLLKAFRERNAASLDRLADLWTDQHTELLATWCRESITQRWSIFSESETDLPGKALPLKILAALRPNIRPRLVVRSNLMSVLRGA